MSWLERATAIGLAGDAAALAAQRFDEVATRHAALFGSADTADAWWIPGRIEVLGKHTDYGGGRSLLCAVERGFHVIASPRADGIIRLVDASTGASATIPLRADAPPRPGHWTDYPISVARRVARDFPGAQAGMNAVVRSSLPSASGMSSSSALVIATFLPLAAFNQLATSLQWQANIADDDALAEYLGAMENGRVFHAFAADRGVGTQGGAEDQTAILRAEPGRLLQYHFIPVTREAAIDVPAGWQFVLAMSGVHAAKGGAAQARYNALAAEIAALTATGNRATARDDRSLFAALRSSSSAADTLAEAVRSEGAVNANELVTRLQQFVAESMDIIPAVARHLAAGEMERLGAPIERSQRLAETALRNQIPETIYLARRATELGAAGSSAFGAGFGGSVWALVPDAKVPEFLTRWRRDYLELFPQHRLRADFFGSRAAPAACRLARLP